MHVVALLTEDGLIIVYRVDASGISKIAAAQAALEQSGRVSVSRVADLTITADGGKVILSLFEGNGKFRSFEITL